MFQRMLILISFLTAVELVGLLAQSRQDWESSVLAQHYSCLRLDRERVETRA